MFGLMGWLVFLSREVCIIWIMRYGLVSRVRMDLQKRGAFLGK